jgi:hypothetical protein
MKDTVACEPTIANDTPSALDPVRQLDEVLLDLAVSVCTCLGALRLLRR